MSDGEKRLNFGIKGMSCASCAQHVEDHLSGTEGIQEADVNIENEKGSVVYNSEKLDARAITDLVKESGYDVLSAKRELIIEGMSCDSCAQSIEESLDSLPGVIEASVDFASEKAVIEYLESSADRKEFVEVIEGAGYGVKK